MRRRNVRHADQRVEVDDVRSAAASALHDGAVVIQVNGRRLGINDTVAMRLDEAGDGAIVSIAFISCAQLLTVELSPAS